MQCKVAFGSSFSVDQFGFVGRGAVITEAETVIFWGKKSWPWLAKLGAFIPITIVLFVLLSSSFLLALLAPFIALVIIHYFCVSRGNLEIPKSSITNVQRQGRWIRFTGQHPKSGEVKQTVFKADNEQCAAFLEYELSSSPEEVPPPLPGEAVEA